MMLREGQQTDLMHAMRFADAITHTLEDFIPSSCWRDVRERLIDLSLRDGLELTSKAMRLEYEAWKRTEIEIMSMTPLVPKC